MKHDEILERLKDNTEYYLSHRGTITSFLTLIAFQLLINLYSRFK